MKREDAKIGMKVVLTGPNRWKANRIWEGLVHLNKGDVVEINEIKNTYFAFLSEDKQIQTLPFDEVEPFMETKMPPKMWYTKVDSFKMKEALFELAKKNGFNIVEREWKTIVAVGFSDVAGVFHCYSFDGWERPYTEISLSEAISILSVPQKKPLTAGGKAVKQVDRTIEVDGNLIPRAALEKMYKRFKEGPIVVAGVGVADFVTANSKTYSAVKLGCTTASAEEVEAIAAELGLNEDRGSKRS